MVEDAAVIARERQRPDDERPEQRPQRHAAGVAAVDQVGLENVAERDDERVQGQGRERAHRHRHHLPLQVEQAAEIPAAERGERHRGD